MERRDGGAPARTHNVARVVVRCRNRPRKRRQNAVVAGDEEDGEQTQLQGLREDGMASPERGGGHGRITLAWEGLELPR